MTEPIRAEVARIAAELDALPFTPGKLIAEHPGVDSETSYLPRSAGAPVYHDVMQYGGNGTRADVLNVADRIVAGLTMATKRQKETAEALAEVARLRLAGSFRVSGPMLPPDAGQFYVPVAVPVQAVEQVSDAALLGAKAAGWLKAHLRKPFGARGEQIIVEQARAAWRAALQGVAA